MALSTLAYSYPDQKSIFQTIVKATSKNKSEAKENQQMFSSKQQPIDLNQQQQKSAQGLQQLNNDSARAQQQLYSAQKQLPRTASVEEVYSCVLCSCNQNRKGPVEEFDKIELLKNHLVKKLEMWQVKTQLWILTSEGLGNFLTLKLNNALNGI